MGKEQTRRTISPDDMREIYDVIIACESMAAELLAGLPEFERGTKANALEALNATMGFALQTDGLLAWAKADDEFHRLLVASCGNGRIARIAETIMDQSHRARMLTLKLRPTPTQSVEEHQLIIDAIRKGLPVEAHNHARAHRARARDTLLPLLDRFGATRLPNKLRAKRVIGALFQWKPHCFIGLALIGKKKDFLFPWLIVQLDNE